MDKQRIILTGRPLTNEFESISDYKIHKGATLIIVERGL